MRDPDGEDRRRSTDRQADRPDAVDSNNLARGFKRVVDDLSSYYLLGYYSNGKLDGKFHSISVRVKRPGVRVRARRGYMAATLATAARSVTAAPAVDSAEAAAAHAVEA